tara:strand:- start:2797 stop:3051 length:255 start_codon:yes stop_codon:yes gene_type:complete
MSEEEQIQEQIAQLEGIVKQKLTKEALLRLGNIKAAHQEKYVQLLVVLGQAIQSNELETVDDTQLKEILQKMAPEKKPFNMRRA